MANILSIPTNWFIWFSYTCWNRCIVTFIEKYHILYAHCMFCVQICKGTSDGSCLTNVGEQKEKVEWTEKTQVKVQLPQKYSTWVKVLSLHSTTANNTHVKRCQMTPLKEMRVRTAQTLYKRKTSTADFSLTSRSLFI